MIFPEEELCGEDDTYLNEDHNRTSQRYNQTGNP
jgi:hypothetical protein